MAIYVTAGVYTNVRDVVFTNRGGAAHDLVGPGFFG